MKRFSFYFFFVFTTLFLSAQQVHITGLVPWGTPVQEFYLRSYTDLITFNDSLLDSAVADSGIVDFNFYTPYERLVFFDYGRIRLKFFVEPGKDYVFKFPIFHPKTIADSLNPYFEPETYQLIPGDSNKTLNKSIVTFDADYENFLNDNFNTLMKEAYHAHIDTFLHRIDSMYTIPSKSRFFKDYVHYRLAMLQFSTIKRDIDYIAFHHYCKNPILYNNPAYMSLLNQMYHSYFQYYVNDENGAMLTEDIIRHSPLLIRKTLKHRYPFQLDSNFTTLVMLKALYDAAYNSPLASFKHFPRRSILMILDSLYQQSSIPEEKTIAYNIKKNIVRDFFTSRDSLYQFTFFDNNNNHYIAKELKGTFSYLLFCDIRNYTCLESLMPLMKLQLKNSKILKVYPIFPHSQYKKVIRYFKKQHITLIPYWVNTANDFSKAGADHLPYASLFDSNGTLLFAPTRLPTEDFQHLLYKIILGMR